MVKAKSKKIFHQERKIRYQKAVKQLIGTLKKYEPKKIILFGSSAQGVLRENSDLDVLIIKETEDPFWERQKKIASLLDIDLPVDAFILTPKEVKKALKNYQPFIYDIITYGKVIYG